MDYNFFNFEYLDNFQSNFYMSLPQYFFIKLNKMLPFFDPVKSNVIFSFPNHSKYPNLPGACVFSSLYGFFLNMIKSISWDLGVKQVRCTMITSDPVSVSYSQSSLLNQLQTINTLHFSDFSKCIQYLIDRHSESCQINELVIKSIPLVSNSNYHPRRQVALITGASQGIGRAIALHLASKKFDVALISRSQDKLLSLQSECLNYGVKARIYSIDVQNLDDVLHAFHQINDEFGGVDLLFCNAGINRRKDLQESSFEIYKSVVDTNFTAHSYLSHLCSKSWIRSTDSIKTIIFAGSIASSEVYNCQQGLSAYYSSKFAMQGFANCISEDLKTIGAKCVMLKIGLVDNELGRKKGPWEADENSVLIQHKDLEETFDFILECSPSCCPSQINLIPPAHIATSYRSLQQQSKFNDHQR